MLADFIRGRPALRRPASFVLRILDIAVAAASQAVCRAVLAVVPVRHAAKLQEKFDLYAPLDYPKGNMRLGVSTYGEYKRATRACSKEPDTVRWIETRVKPGEVFYDIGANVGAYSFVALAHTRRGCRVYAFEPSFSTFASLCKNIYANRCGDRMTPVQVALSNKTALVTFKYSNLQPGAAFHAVGRSLDDNDPVHVLEWDEDILAQRGLHGRNVSKGAVFEPMLSQPIFAFKLDDLVEKFGIEAPQHIKIDVDGAELDVLQGAADVLARPQMLTLLIEMHRSVQPPIDDFLATRGLLVSEVNPCSGEEYVNVVYERR
jgi:FkbM family methyltransferase